MTKWQQQSRWTITRCVDDNRLVFNEPPWALRFRSLHNSTKTNLTPSCDVNKNGNLLTTRIVAKNILNSAENARTEWVEKVKS